MLGGVQSYFGYDYQFLVTALLMLLAHKDPNSKFSKIRVETTFGHDAELVNAEKEFAVRQELKSPIYVQIKTKALKYQWTSSDIRDLLLKQDESSPNGESVLKRLATTDEEIYIFITDGILQPSFAGLLGSDLGYISRRYPEKTLDAIRLSIIQSDKKGIYRQELEQYLTDNVLQKVFIFSGLSPDDAKRRIREILRIDYGIPIMRIDEVSKILIDLVRDCALRTNNIDSITAEDIRNVIGDAGVTLPYQYLENIFQRPMDYDQGLRILNEKHLLIITGEPAVGKTTLGQKYLNELAEKHYSFEELYGSDSYLKIIKACGQTDNVVFFLNDPFGYEEYDHGKGSPLGNQLFEIATQLSQAKGRVKLIITSRSNVISKAITSTNLRKIFIDGYRITLPIPDADLIEKVLIAHLRSHELTSNKVDLIMSYFGKAYENFEDILHVRDFANQIFNSNKEVTSVNIQQAFIDSRPSLYKNWIANQSSSVQLYLLSLWLLVEVNQIAYEVDIQRVFEKLEVCYSLPQHEGIGSNYLNARQNLLDHERIRLSYSSRINFIHPYLKSATRDYFQQHPGLSKLLICLVNTLKGSDNPVDQSIAAAIVTIYYEILGMPLELLNETYISKFLQVRDTIIRYATGLLKINHEGTRQFIDIVYSNDYGPEDCVIDDHNHLILKDPKFSLSESAEYFSNIYEAIKWDWEFDFNKDPELEALLQGCVTDHNLHRLNDLQRYKFVDWITTSTSCVNRSELIKFLDILSLDPITFIRKRVISRIGATQSLEDPDIFHIFNRLCFDSSPFVKITALESGILPNWVKLSVEKQEQLLKITIQLLEDQVFRSRTAMGLIDQSGSRYYYHKDHTPEQKQKWFGAIALKLLEYDIEDYDIDKFLAAFDKHYKFFSTPFKIQLITSLESYIKEHPNQAKDVPLTIEKVVLDASPSKDELDIIFRFISQLPSIAKASICFRLAQNYEKLTDQRLKGFVHRPFFMEEPHEFVVERAAGVLGFLSNKASEKKFDMLPEPLRGQSGNFEEAIKNYIETQSDEFRYMLISHSYGYEYSSGISAVHHNLYSHPIIMDQIDYFINKGTISEFSKFVIHIFLGRGYYLWDESEQSRSIWWEYLDKLMRKTDIDLLKSMCDILFSYNVSSNVQNIRDWMIILSQLLKHQNDKVRAHAFALFDRHFISIWEEIIQPVIDDENKIWRKEADDIWFNGEFINYLIDNSPRFSEYIKYQSYFHEAAKNWGGLSNEQQNEIVTTLFWIADKGKYHLICVVKKFIQDMGDKFPKSDKELLESKITAVKEYERKDTLGRLEQIELDNSLMRYEPKFDWSIYIQ